jgi:hypothetical protein
MLVGNHDAYYKNTNSVNSPGLLLQNYSNIKTYSDPEVVKIGNLNTLFIPWICADNEEKTLRLIKKSGCKIAMGHLELNGFEAYRGHTMDDGMDSVVFDGFVKVFSGHYHTRSNNGTVFYEGLWLQKYDLATKAATTILSSSGWIDNRFNFPHKWLPWIKEDGGFIKSNWGEAIKVKIE